MQSGMCKAGGAVRLNALRARAMATAGRRALLLTLSLSLAPYTFPFSRASSRAHPSQSAVLD